MRELLRVADQHSSHRLLERSVFISLSRGLIFMLRLPLLTLIAVGAVVVCAASLADDWLKGRRPSLARAQFSVVALADFRRQRRSLVLTAQRPDGSDRTAA